MSIVNKKSVYILVIVSFIFVSACDANRHEYDLNQSVKDYLESFGVENYRINRCQEKDKSIEQYKVSKLPEFSVTEGEVDQYIERVLKSYDEIEEDNNRKIVKKGDLVTISFQAYMDGKLVNQQDDLKLTVGDGTYDLKFEKKLVDSKVGSQCKFRLSNPNENDETELFVVRIKAINKYIKCKLTDDFVKKEFHQNSVADYKEYVQEQIKENKLQEWRIEKEEEIFATIIENSDIAINEEQVASYALAVVDKYKQISDVNGYEQISDYVQDNGKTMDEFYQICYEEAEQELKKIIIIGVYTYGENMGENDGKESGNNDHGYSQLKKEIFGDFGLY